MRISSETERFMRMLYAGHRPIVMGYIFAAVAFHVWGLVWLAAIILFVFVWDAFARLGDFDKMWDERRLIGWYTNTRRLNGSWCSRGVAVAVYGKRARQYYYHNGYRWYHVLPDDFPRCFLKRNFWYAAFQGNLHRRGSTARLKDTV